MTVRDRPACPRQFLVGMFIKNIFREHKLKMKKMEKEMENVFETKVKEKKQKLKDSEHELTQKHKNVSNFRPCRPCNSETNDPLVHGTFLIICFSKN